MITLYKFSPAWGLPDISPFCLKAESYLRMAGLEYRTVTADSRKAPKGKCPYIEHDGAILCDSNAIVSYLESRVPKPLDAGLGPREKAIATAFKALFEEQLYFVICWQRWIDPAGWKIYRPVLFSLGAQLGVPALFAPVIAAMLRRKMKRTLWLQGTGRHSPDEISALAASLLTSVSEWLGDQPYMLGKLPHSIDATAYAFLAALLWTPFEGPIKDHALGLGNLVPYCEHMKAQFWR